MLKDKKNLSKPFWQTESIVPNMQLVIKQKTKWNQAKDAEKNV